MHPEERPSLSLSTVIITIVSTIILTIIVVVAVVDVTFHQDDVADDPTQQSASFPPASATTIDYQDPTGRQL